MGGGGTGQRHPDQAERRDAHAQTPPAADQARNASAAACSGAAIARNSG